MSIENNNFVKKLQRQELSDISEVHDIEENIKCNSLMTQHLLNQNQRCSKNNTDKLLIPSLKRQDTPSVKTISEYPIVMGLNAGEYKNDRCSMILVVISWILIVLFFPFSLICTFKKVKEYQRGVKFRLGRLKNSSIGPGLIFYLPCIETSDVVDLRTFSFEVAPQEVLTKDSVTVSVDAVVYYRVFNPAVSISNVENADASTRLLAQTTLRNVLGQKSLSEILSDRDTVSQAIRECLDEATGKLK